MATLLRARQAEFAWGRGHKDPDAWNIGVVEPDVPIDIHKQLSEEQMDRAWGRWRTQWQERIPLTDKQKEQKRTWSTNKLNEKMRSNFAAFLKNLMGETHVAKCIIRNGVGSKHGVYSIKEFINKLITERTKQKEKERVAPEHASELRKAAHFARDQLREGRRLAKKPYFELSSENQTLVDKYNDETLARETDEANERYGYGVARTADFGHTPGQNMHSFMPRDMLALLRLKVPRFLDAE